MSSPGLAPLANRDLGSPDVATLLVRDLPIIRPKGTVRPGQTLGKCLLLDRAGAGGCGVVFKARHLTLHIPVAVKVLHVGSDPSVRRQLRTEARLLAQLCHPHIVRVWDFEDDPEVPYLVLEYVDGPNLADVLRDRGAVPAWQAVRLVAQIADALAAAAKRGIVHRDVKPSNILLTRGGSAKLADLGLAVLVGQGHNSAAGTAAFMAPEQAAGEAIDHRADIYSLGATFYHLVTGRVPFLAPTRDELTRRHAQQPLPAARPLVPNLSGGVMAVIARMMAKSPDHRYQSYDQLRAELDRLPTADRAIDTTGTVAGHEAELSAEIGRNAPSDAVH